MSDLVEWEYGGHTFHVAASLTEAAKDSACARLLSEWEQRATRLKPGINVSLSKPLEVPSGMIPSIPCQDRLESVRDTSAAMHALSREVRGGMIEAMEAEAAKIDAEELRYANGYYRLVCPVCGKPMQRTGQRGRPRKSHRECVE